MDIKDRDYLGEDASDYWYFVGKRDLIWRVLSSLRVKSFRDVLVVGVGVGEDFSLLSSYGNVTALDVSSEALSQVPSGFSKVNTGIEDTDFNEDYDLVLMLDVLEHIEDDSIALNKVYKALRKGGVLVITVPAYMMLFGPHDTYLGHHRRYGLSELEGLLRKAGFSEVKLSYWNSLLFPPIFLEKIIQKLVYGGKSKSGLVKLPDLLNKLLTIILRKENKLRRYVRLPFGATILGVVEKK